MKLSRRDIVFIVALFAAALVLLLVGIGYPPTQIFDEPYYITAAKEFLHHDLNENWSHPPLGKILIGFGIAVFGDRSFGWRFMGGVFGALTVSGVYFWTRTLLRSQRAALWAALLTLFDQILFVQARIAMLDAFMVAFSVWALGFAAEAWLERRRKRLWTIIAFSALMGLATACKWSGVVGWFVGAGVLALSNLRTRRFRWGVLLSALVGPALVAYFAVFSVCIGMEHPSYAPPIHASQALAKSAPSQGELAPLEQVPPTKPEYGVLDLFRLQLRMLRAQLDLRGRPLTYSSEWWSWPLMLRPIWYYSQGYVDDDGGSSAEGIVLLGNPLIMWGGLLALLLCVALGARARSPEAALLVTCYLAFALCWAVLPRKTAFYYYYYPAGIVLSLVIAWVLEQGARWRSRLGTRLAWAFVAACAIVFAFYYPVLVGTRLPLPSLQKRILLRTWI